MSINWFTLIAQVVNFLILVWLLKRYLYKPILKAIDERDQKITSQIQDADKKKAEAKKEHERFEMKNNDFDKQKHKLLNEAIEEVKTKREQLLNKAKSDVDDLRKKLENVVKEEQEHLGDEIMRMTKTEVFSISKKLLKELADSTLEKQVVRVFIERLKNLTEEENKKLREALKPSKEIVVQSAFELAASQQMEIEKIMEDILPVKVVLQFKTEPELIGGVELNANGYKIAWNISEYLFSIEKTVEELFDSKVKTDSVETATT